jgi:hypothetical protein
VATGLDAKPKADELGVPEGLLDRAGAPPGEVAIKAGWVVLRRYSEVG